MRWLPEFVYEYGREIGVGLVTAGSAWLIWWIRKQLRKPTR